MPIPIWKDCPEMDGLMNLEDAKGLLNASFEIQKFIECVSQSLSRKISSNLYDTIETKAIESYECSFNIKVVEDYAKDYERDNDYKIRVTENVLEKIAFRIGELFREQGFYAGGHIKAEYSCAYIAIEGWGKDFDR